MKSPFVPAAIALLYGLLPRFGLAQATVSTLAGSGTVGLTDGPGPTAQFNYPYGVTQDALGNTYVADAFNHAIRKISPAGVVTTLAGTGSYGYGNSPVGTAAAFNDPEKVVSDPSGNLYVADPGNGSIRRVFLNGAVTTYAGTGQQGYVDGPAATDRFFGPTGLALDPGTSNLYVAEGYNFRIRRVDATGMIASMM